MSLYFNQQNNTIITSSGILDLSLNMGAINLPIGGISVRPSINTAGAIRYNSDLDALEINNGTSWAEIGSGGISGPISSTQNAIVTWANTSGQTLSNSPVTVDGSGNVSNIGTLSANTGNINALIVNNSIKVPTQVSSDNSTNAASTNFVHSITDSISNTANTALTEINTYPKCVACASVNQIGSLTNGFNVSSFTVTGNVAVVYFTSPLSSANYYPYVNSQNGAMVYATNFYTDRITLTQIGTTAINDFNLSIFM